jgi:hypothetical protein
LSQNHNNIFKNHTTLLHVSDLNAPIFDDGPVRSETSRGVVCSEKILLCICNNLSALVDIKNTFYNIRKSIM